MPAQAATLIVSSFSLLLTTVKLCLVLFFLVSSPQTFRNGSSLFSWWVCQFKVVCRLLLSDCYTCGIRFCPFMVVCRFHCTIGLSYLWDLFLSIYSLSSNDLNSRVCGEDTKKNKTRQNFRAVKRRLKEETSSTELPLLKTTEIVMRTFWELVLLQWASIKPNIVSPEVIFLVVPNRTPWRLRVTVRRGYLLVRIPSVYEWIPFEQPVIS